MYIAKLELQGEKRVSNILCHQLYPIVGDIKYLTHCITVGQPGLTGAGKQVLLLNFVGYYLTVVFIGMKHQINYLNNGQGKTCLKYPKNTAIIS